MGDQPQPQAGFDTGVGPCVVLNSTVTTTTLDLATGASVFVLSVVNAFTLAFTGWPPSGVPRSFKVVFKQDSSGHTVTNPTGVTWAGGSAPTVSATASHIGVCEFYSEDGGTTIRGRDGGQSFA